MMFVVSGPSGCGKTTLIGRVLAGVPGPPILRLPYHPAEGGTEVDGREYHFVPGESSRPWPPPGRSSSGRSCTAIATGRPGPRSKTSGDVVLDIDVQGARQIRRSGRPASSSSSCLPSSPSSGDGSGPGDRRRGRGRAPAPESPGRDPRLPRIRLRRRQRGPGNRRRGAAVDRPGRALPPRRPDGAHRRHSPQLRRGGSPVTAPKTVALGVTSSISIYKACEVLRGFQKSGFRSASS